MKLVVFGLSVSSSWGNGHATLWRGLCAALGRLGHSVVFFEKDVPYYAAARDLAELPGGELILYGDWRSAMSAMRRHLSDADVAMVTSFCPDGIPATGLILESRARLRVFYDLDTPVTLARLARGEPVEYIGPRGLGDFDLVLSYTGGQALLELQRVLGARRVHPLYGSVEPQTHCPAAPEPRFSGILGHLGTYAADREARLQALFVEPSRRLPQQRFVLAGSMYGGSFPWQPNIFLIPHLAPADHRAFYCSTRLTLNVTRDAMAQMGYCPSGRLFEAAACGAPILSDGWEGLDQFFEPGSEILVAQDTNDAMDALARGPEELARIARAARERTLAVHTAAARAKELESLLEAACGSPDQAMAEAL